MKHSARRPSPALIVAAIALVFALVGTSIADSSGKITRKKVKTIAGQVVDQKAAGLTVGKATTATTATNATNATNAVNALNSTNATTATNAKSLDLYAHINATTSLPTVNASRSKGITSADFKDVGAGNEGFVCANLPAYKTALGTQDEPIATATVDGFVQVFPDPGGAFCTANFGTTGTNTLILFTDGTGLAQPGEFDLVLGT